MTTEHERVAAKPTGRKYDSVEALMQGEGVSEEVQKQFAEIEHETKLVHCLEKLRHAVGLTQEELAKRMGVTQSAISKLESGRDEDLTIGTVRAYAKATEERIGLSFGKPMNHVESIRGHALAMRRHLLALSKSANNYEEMEKNIQAFFGEAFFNILLILSECQGEMPNPDAVEVRIQLLNGNPGEKKIDRKSITHTAITV